MNGILVYAVKSAIYLTIFYIFYFIFLSRDTSYSRNRIYILLSVLCSFLLPLITIRNTEIAGAGFIAYWLNEVFIGGSRQTELKIADTFGLAAEKNTILIIYITGFCLLVIKLAADLLNLLILIIRHREPGSRIIKFHSFNTAGFSAMGHIFLNSGLEPDEEKEIIRHEENHLRRMHFIDIIFIGITRALQWFNPFIYLFDRSLRAIHEYQADRECIDSGLCVSSYQNLLMKQVLRVKSFSLTNSFSNPSLLRKRMLMMTRSKTSSAASLKILAVVPVALLTLLAFSSFEFTDNSLKETKSISKSAPEVIYGADAFLDEAGTNANTPFVIADQMPVFPGGDIELLKYIASNTVYPEAAKEKNIQGRVIVRFCVNADGNIDRISVLKGVDPELDAEAVRVVSTLPAFKPAMNDGKMVPVWYMVPLTFTLR